MPLTLAFGVAACMHLCTFEPLVQRIIKNNFKKEKGAEATIELKKEECATIYYLAHKCSTIN